MTMTVANNSSAEEATVSSPSTSESVSKSITAVSQEEGGGGEVESSSNSPASPTTTSSSNHSTGSNSSSSDSNNSGDGMGTTEDKEPTTTTATTTTTTTTTTHAEDTKDTTKQKSSSATTTTATEKYVPEDKDQWMVQTPYGKGLVLRTRKEKTTTSREIELIDWKVPTDPTVGRKSNSKRFRPSKLFTTVEYPSVVPKVGDDIICLYGRGRIVEIREENNAANSSSSTKTIIVRLSSWRLAKRSVVLCHLTIDPATEPTKRMVQVVRPKKLYEMSVVERIEHAQTLKDEASTFFKNKNYAEAIQLYANAVDCIRYIQHKADSTNEVRCDLLVLMITCSNNAATCCIQLEQYERVINFSQGALSLIEALDNKRGNAIHALLTSKNDVYNYSDCTIFGLWRVKSYINMSKSLIEHKQQYDAAIYILKQAHETIAKYSKSSSTNPQKDVQNVLRLDKEVKRLHTICKDRKKEVLKKEKLRAQAMFGGGGTTTKSEGKGSSAKASSPTKKTATSSPSSSPTASVPTTTTTTKEDIQRPSSPKPSLVTSLNRSSMDGGDSTNPGTTAPASNKNRNVHFANGTKGDDDDDESEQPWYEEHFELLALSTAFLGIGLLSTIFLKKRAV